MSEQRKIRLGMIGLGGISRAYLDALRKIDDIEIIAGYDVAKDVCEQVRQTLGIRAVESLPRLLEMDEIEAVTIGTPNHFHAQHIQEAAKARKHVCVTKPITNTLPEAEVSIRVCRQAGVKLMVGHEMRYRPCFLKFAQLLEQGAIGKVSQIVSFFGHQGGLRSGFSHGWRAQWENVPGGSLNLLGIHNIDGINMVFGRPVAVSAVCKSLITEGELEDTTQTITEYESGQIAVVGSSYCSYGGWWITAYGTEATLTVDFNAGVTLQRAEREERYRVVLENGFVNMFREFAECIRADRAPSCSGEDGRLALAVNWASIISEREKRRVTIDEALRHEQPVIET